MTIIRREILCRGGGSSTGGSASEQLKKTFEFYSKWIPSSMQRFDSIYINLRNFTTIEADLFKGLKFANILLSGGELTFIHRDAFVGTEQHIYTMFIYGTNLSSKVNTDQDFFASIRKLVNLQKLIIFQNKLIEIPHNAFALESLAQNNETQTKKQLTEIQITEGSIVSIGTDAFADLMHLEQLSLNKNRINLIRSYAFRIHHKSNATLILDLTDNDLSPISFETNAFLGANRPLKIHLGLNGCNHKLDRLPEEIFRPFLDENPSNTIDVGRNCLNLKCGCQMAWMLSERYRLRVKNFRCYDSQNHSVYFSDYIRDDSCQYTRPNKFFSIAVSNNSTQSTDKAKNFE
ncbi:slit protein-like protein 2 [Sarcoptes scabiei]|uniref:Slit protein-like protein 2 n=1 Tax=Sarcoptes scabiei TaxID=52283 RepID=A0A132AI73_SARSC|nr:slit protein-like protein 2 [Sarcoptes scabiei]